MAQAIKRGDYVNVPGMDIEVEVTGVDNGTDSLIVHYYRASKGWGYKTVSREGVTLYVETEADTAADDAHSDRFHNR